MPPYWPEHVQLHGPVPLTEVLVPALQRWAPAVGAVVRVVPWAEPQAALTAGGISAEQDASGAPLMPAQVQLHGRPVPLTLLEAPSVQRLDEGAEVTTVPSAEPQAPATGHIFKP